MEFLTRLASLYYLKGKTQAEVAGELSISRQKVQRFLQECREEGVVEINIRTLPLISLELEDRLREKFGLLDVVVANSHSNQAESRRSVARAAASYLERNLKKGMAITVGMGRNTGEIPNFFNPSHSIDCTFLPAMGSSPHVGETINPSDICAKLSMNCKGKSFPLYAPAYVESQQVRDILIAQAAVGSTLQKAKNADMAIVGIGAPTDNATLVRMDCLSRTEVRHLKKTGAVGDILGAFFDQQGHMLASDLYGRLVGLALEDLRRIKTVVAVVSEHNKAGAIFGALQTGVLKVLITDSDNAQKVFDLTK